MLQFFNLSQAAAEGSPLPSDATPAERLIRKLNHWVPAQNPIQKTLIAVATRTACAAFAVLLRHVHGARRVLEMAMTASTQDSAVAPPKAVCRLWLRAIQIKSVVADKRASGADPQLFADSVIAKARLMLLVGMNKPEASVSLDLERQLSHAHGTRTSGGAAAAASRSRSPVSGASSPTTPTHAGRTLATSAAATASPGRKVSQRWSQARVMVKLVVRYMAAASNVKRLMIAANRLTSQSAGQMPEVTSLLRFLEDSDVDADSMRRALLEQFAQASTRLFALHIASNLLGSVALPHRSRPDLVVPLIVHLADATRAQNLYADSGTDRVHFLDRLPAIGRAMARAITDSYFSLVCGLIQPNSTVLFPVSTALSAAPPSSPVSPATPTTATTQSAVLALLDLDLTPTDLSELHTLSLVTFVMPLFSLVGNHSPELLRKVLPNLSADAARAVTRQELSKGIVRCSSCSRFFV